jgi:hypothetical protein
MSLSAFDCVIVRRLGEAIVDAQARVIDRMKPVASRVGRRDLARGQPPPAAGA